VVGDRVVCARGRVQGTETCLEVHVWRSTRANEQIRCEGESALCVERGATAVGFVSYGDVWAVVEMAYHQIPLERMGLGNPEISGG